jgi:iron complex outermembrane receptor protein
MRWNRINTADIRQIEIFKGSGSSIYGSNAMGGVINIITKSPDTPFEGKVSAGYGTYNTRKGSVRFAGEQAGESGFFGQVAATGLKSDGFTSLTEASKHYENRVDRFVEEFAVNTKAGYRFNSSNTVELAYSYFDDQRGEGYRYNLDKGSRRDFDTDSLNLIYKGGTGPWQVNIGGFYQNEAYFWHRDFADPDDIYTVNSDREDYGTSASLARDFGEKNTLTMGADTRFSSVDAVDDYDTSDDYAKNRGNLDQYALFFQDEIRLMDDSLIMTAGLRYDHVRFTNGRYESTIPPFDAFSGDMDSNSWSALSPKLAARYHVNSDLSLYTSYARGFRAPILDALCRYGIFHGRFYDANPDLENETIDTLELGGELSLLDDRLDLTLSSYYSRGKDFIYSVDTGEARFLWGRNRAVYKMENASEVIIKGLEADLKWQIAPAVKLFAGYTFNDSYIETFDKRPDLEGKQLEYVPRHSASIGLDILTPVVNASIVLNHVGSQYADDRNTNEIQSYHTVDLKLWRDLNIIMPGLRADLTVLNLLDEEYLVDDDEKGTGLFAVVELSYAW